MSADDSTTRAEVSSPRMNSALVVSFSGVADFFFCLQSVAIDMLSEDEESMETIEQLRLRLSLHFCHLLLSRVLF